MLQWVPSLVFAYFYHLSLRLVLALVVPAAYNAAYPAPLQDGHRTENGILIISRGTSVLLLFVYAAYLYFQVRNRIDLIIYSFDF